MPNGFDLVDQLFSGFIAFIYNVLETGFRLLTRPTQAPSLLLRRFRSKTTRQISGITCLVLSATTALILMLPAVPSVRVAGIDLRALVPTPEGQVKFTTIVPFLIGGIAIAILVDVLARVTLAAVRVPRERRTAIVARLAYAISFFPLALSIYVMLFRFTPWLDWLATPTSDGTGGAELFVPMILILRGAQLVGTTAAHAIVSPRRKQWRDIVRKTVGAAMIFVYGAAAVVGANVTSAVHKGDAKPAQAVTAPVAAGLSSP